MGVEDECVHRLRDVDEADAAGQLDQRHFTGTAGRHQLVGHLLIPVTELHDQTGRADVGELVDVATQLGGVLGIGHAGRQDQLAALEEIGGVE